MKIGNKILVIEEEMKESRRNFHGFNSPWDRNDELVAYIEEIESGRLHLTYPFDENGIEEKEWPYGEAVGEARIDTHIEGIRCECRAQFVYHDGKEEWVCPFCEMQ